MLHFPHISINIMITEGQVTLHLPDYGWTDTSFLMSSILIIPQMLVTDVSHRY